MATPDSTTGWKFAGPRHQEGDGRWRWDPHAALQCAATALRPASSIWGRGALWLEDLRRRQWFAASRIAPGYQDPSVSQDGCHERATCLGR